MKTETKTKNYFMRTAMTLLAMMLTTSMAWADVEINEANFPDDNFREWLLCSSLLCQYYDVLTDEEIERITEIDVSNKGIADMTGIEFFTALETLNCSYNQLTTLNVCGNTVLSSLDCSCNQLTSLYVSNNPNLNTINCANNNLTTLDVSSCTALKYFNIDCNQISGEAMDNLIASLPTLPEGEEGFLRVADLTSEDEHNVITTTQVAAARAKNYIVKAWMPGWQEYDGVEPTMLADNADNTSVVNDNAGSTGAVTLVGRTLYTDGDWNTLCLPFNIADLRYTPLEGFTVMELDTDPNLYEHATGLEDGTLYLNFKNATGIGIEAGKPYIVKKTVAASAVSRKATDGTAGFSAIEGYASLVDGNTHTKWCSDENYSECSPWVCQFQTVSPVSVTGYTLTTCNDTYDDTSDYTIDYRYRNPTRWELKAKVNEDDEWTEIDSRNVYENGDDSLPETNTTESQVYAIADSLQGIYQYFCFTVYEITAPEIDSNSNSSKKMQLSELTLKGVAVGITNPIFNGVTIDASAPTAVNSADGTVSFKGSYSPVVISGEDKSILFLGAANTLYYPNAAMQIGACRAHFELNDIPASAEVRAFCLNFDDRNIGTGLGRLIDNEQWTKDSEVGAWYDMSGRRLVGKPTQHGIYINNGRKTVIK